MKKLRIFLVLFLLCTGIFFFFPQHAAALGETTTVQINGQPPSFSPALLTIHLYDTVIFLNHTNTSYTITSDDGSISSPAIPAGQQWRVTFSSSGGHSYHTMEAPQRMIGEILVVANTVSLLPTPVPQVEATVVTLIKAGKHPPDVIILPVTTPQVAKHKVLTPTLNTFLSPLNLSIGGGVLLALALLFLGIMLYRRHKKRMREEEEMDTLLEEIVPTSISAKPQKVHEEVNPKKRRLLPAGFSWKRARFHEDDDDDIDDDDK